MKFLNLCTGAAIVLAQAFPVAIAASDEVKVSVVITIGKQDESPVKIVGFKLPAQVGGLPAIVVRNTTSKEVQLLSLANYLGNPKGVGGAEPQWGGNLGTGRKGGTQQRTLDPDATAEFQEEALRPYDAGFWAHRLHSSCLHAAFFVARVDFADGTKWDWNQPGPYETVRDRLSTAWKDSIRPESTKGCDDSLATREALDHLSGTAWTPVAGPSSGNTDVAPFLAFSCTIRGDTAWCQW